MEIFHLFENALYLLSKLFFYPVVICLFLLLAYVFFTLGGFAREAFRRWKNKGYYSEPFLEDLKRDSFFGDPDQYEAHLEGILFDSKVRNIRKVNAAKYCVKMGPTLGLIGTLTPMANALAGLSAGDLSVLSGQMITAFSTTVLGLIVGGIAYTIAHVRLKWQHQDQLVLSKEADQQFFRFKERSVREAV